MEACERLALWLKKYLDIEDLEIGIPGAQEKRTEGDNADSKR